MRIGGVGGPPRTGPGRISTAGSKAESEVCSAPCNSPPWGWWWLAALSPWELRRFYACGRRMVEDCTAAGRMPPCIKYIVFICAFCAKSPLVRMRSPVQIWLAAPHEALEPQGFGAFCFFFQQIERRKKPDKNPDGGKKRSRTGQPCPAFFVSCLRASRKIWLARFILS